MRKTLPTTIGLLVMTLFLTFAMTPVRAYVSSYYWGASLYRGYDSYYDTYVTAYKVGSIAQLLVDVYNDYYTPINVTAVKVSFDWNVNYTSTECPYVMLGSEYHPFMINFTVPQTNIASDMFPHSYVIYVEYAYDNYTSYWSYYPYEAFAVYSADHAAAVSLQAELNARFSYVPSFNSYEARMMLSEAQIERGIGDYMYSLGDFASARTHYANVIGLFDQAVATESNYTEAYDKYYMTNLEAQLNATKLQAEANKEYADAALSEQQATMVQAKAAMVQAHAPMVQADAAMAEANAAMIQANATKTQADAAATTANATFNQSNAWFLFGIGFIIISIGVLVYAIRKPKIVKAP
jgi:hypothetical protein